MNSRCYNTNFVRYSGYGGRGIVICDEWRGNYQAFRSWAMAHGYADNLTIERKDNDGPYSADNCTWIPLVKQSWNKRNSRRLTIFGETKIVAEWAEDPRSKVTQHDLCRRIDKLKWTPERALTEPLQAIAPAESRTITFQGHTLSARAWAKRLGFTPSLIYTRIYRGITNPAELLAPASPRAPYGSRKINQPL
jgi:hypothetical protein